VNAINQSKLNETLVLHHGPQEQSEEQEFPMNTRFCRSFAILVLAPVTISTLYADVTTRFKTETTMNPALQALAAGAMKEAGLAAPQETAFRLKGGKGFSSSMGITSIVDLTTKEMTVLDAATMRYAKMTSEQFVDEAARAMPQMPAGASAAIAAMKTSVSSTRLTGRTAVIQGVEVEEREMVVTVEGPPIPNAPAGPAIRMVMQLWTAKASEVTRVPAIRELTGYYLDSFATMNPIANIDKMLKQFPGLAGAIEPLMKEMHSRTPMLRMHIDLFMPAMIAIIQRMAAGGNSPGASLDESAPLVQVNYELVELSTAPVPDSVFQIPEGYREASPSELIRALLPKSKAPVQQ
jgi:hypothetical protein